MTIDRLEIRTATNLVLFDHSAVVGVRRVVDDCYTCIWSRTLGRCWKGRAHTAIGASGRYRGERESAEQVEFPGTLRDRRMSERYRCHLRSELLELVSNLTLVEFSIAGTKLFFQPRKVPSQSSAVTDMALAEAFQLRVIFDGLQFGDQGWLENIFSLEIASALFLEDREILTSPTASATARLDLSPSRTFYAPPQMTHCLNRRTAGKAPGCRPS